MLHANKRPLQNESCATLSSPTPTSLNRTGAGRARDVEVQEKFLQVEDEFDRLTQPERFILDASVTMRSTNAISSIRDSAAKMFPRRSRFCASRASSDGRSGPPYVREVPPSELSIAVPANQREQILEATLGMVWFAFAATGPPDAQPNTALWNLVNTIAPDALKISQTTPQYGRLSGQYNT